MVDKGIHIRCPHCRNPVEVVTEAEFEDVECPSCGSEFNLVGDDTIAFDSESNSSTTIVDRFELVEVVGRGAFGTVWKANDQDLDRTVAIKIPRSGQLDREQAGSFLREARSAAQLNHANIVSVHEIGRDNGHFYIVSDFIDGVTLESWLSAERPSIQESLELLIKIGSAVQHAHDSGVVHRDLKPSNIMLDAQKEPQVMDFGLAKREAGEITVTMTGAQLGTPAYMPPEQVGSAQMADARSDVYSLGVIMYKMLTGELPFRGDQAMLLYQLKNEEPPSPRKLVARLPRDVETICMKCLHKSPDRRYQSAQDLIDDFDRFLQGQPIKARPPHWLELAARWYSRHATSFLGVFFIVVAFCTILIGLVGNFFEDTPSPFMSSVTHQALMLATLAIGVLVLQKGIVGVWVAAIFDPFFFAVCPTGVLRDDQVLGITYILCSTIAVSLTYGALINYYIRKRRGIL